MEVDDENDNEAHEVLENADYDLIVVGKGPFPSTVKDFESLEKSNDKKSIRIILIKDDEFGTI
jgi:hypothetical protein